MNSKGVLFACSAACFLLIIGSSSAQQKSTPAPKPEPEANPNFVIDSNGDDKWDEIDQRLVFLMVRLANLEASLEAIDAVVAKSNQKATSKNTEAKRAEQKNDQMDRNGGGPMKWSQFYGTTADKFFYHPTTRNSTYHTEVILLQQSQARQGNNVRLSVNDEGSAVQRPPQFDYIYRANENAKANAEKEADKLRGQITKLLDRKRKLEAEQSALWCEVAFRSVSHYDLHKKPLYRFEPLIDESEPNAKQHCEIIKSATEFMRLSLSIMDAAQRDQSKTFKSIKTTVAKARDKLDDTFLRQGVDTSDKKTTEGRFAALSKVLEDIANNLSDSYEAATEGDKEKDQVRKNTFRGLLQQSLISYSQLVLALDEMAVLMRDDYKVQPDLEKPIAIATKVKKTTNAVDSKDPDTEMEAAEDENASMPSDESNEENAEAESKEPSLNLIRLIKKPEQHTVKGGWQLSKDVLSNTKNRSVFGFPVEVFGNYELTFDIKRTKGNDVTIITLPVEKRNVYLELSSDHGGYHGLSFVNSVHSSSNGTASRPGKMQNGAWQNVRVRIGKEGDISTIDVWINGKKAVAWKGDSADLSVDKNWSPPNRSQIGIATSDNQVELRKVNAKGDVRSTK